MPDYIEKIQHYERFLLVHKEIFNGNVDKTLIFSGIESARSLGDHWSAIELEHQLIVNYQSDILGYLYLVKDLMLMGEAAEASNYLSQAISILHNNNQ